MSASSAASATKADAAGKAADKPVETAPAKDPATDPGEGYEWVTTQWLEELVNRRTGERRTYQGGEVYEGALVAEYINPDPAKYGACGPLVKKRKIRSDSESADNTEGN